MARRDLPHVSTPTLDDILAADPDDGDDETLDAVLTAAALIARADGWVQRVERRQLLAFVDRTRLSPGIATSDIIEAFSRRIRKLRKPGGDGAALRRLARQAGRTPARLALDVAEEIAAADGRLDPREDHLLRMIRIALRPPPAPPRSEPAR